MMNHFLPSFIRENHGTAGNCAYWTSSGLEFVNLIKRTRIFPKGIWVELFETAHAKDPDNCHVVQYKEVEHAVKMDGSTICTGNGYSIITPLQWLQGIYYWDLSRFTDVV